MRVVQAGTVALFLIWLAAVILLGTAASEGLFFYTLDDPYIHLSVAENILQGGYGVNAGEYSSPSSSILFPLLLVPFEAIGLGQYAGLILSVPAVVFSIWVLVGLSWQATVGDSALSQLLPWLMAPLVIVAVNGVGLPLNGMEHSLHLALTIAVCAWLLNYDPETPVPIWLVLAAIAVPLIRFEGLALVVGLLALLIWLRRWIASACITIGIVLAIGVYVAAMQSLGLPVLPSSVLTKSSESAALLADDAGSGLLSQAFKMVQATLTDLYLGSARTLAFAVALFILLLGRRPAISAPLQRLLMLLIFVSAGHLAFGAYDWFSRYEIYLIGAILVGFFAAIASTEIKSAFAPWARAAASAALLIGISSNYILDTYFAPYAMRNIYAQQYQMQRFATEFFPEPVAVNDLGLVSYHNDQHVLDLWGLGSEEARIARSDGLTPEETHRLATKAGSVFAMVYDDWLAESIPEEWCRIALLETIQISSASGEVAFYLIDRDREADMRDALLRFGTPKDPASTLTLADCDAG